MRKAFALVLSCLLASPSWAAQGVLAPMAAFVRQEIGPTFSAIGTLTPDRIKTIATNEDPAARLLAAAVIDPAIVAAHRQEYEALLGGTAALAEFESAVGRAARAGAAAGIPDGEAPRLVSWAMVDLKGVKADANAFDGLGQARALAEEAAVSAPDAPSQPKANGLSLSAPKSQAEFNEMFKVRGEKGYARLNEYMRQRFGKETAEAMRYSETPVFIPRPLLDQAAAAGLEIIKQIATPEFIRASEKTIPADFKAPNEDAQPNLMMVDFGVVKDENGVLRPKVIELQAAASHHGLLPLLAQAYKDAYGLDAGLEYLLGGMTWDQYKDLHRNAILGKHEAKNVVLLEIEPEKQKTRADFYASKQLWGVEIVDIMKVKKQGRKLFYEKDGELVPIHRLYNRIVPWELTMKGLKPAFSFTDDLDVEWVTHPNWVFRMSKFALPFLKHETVPESRFLSDVKELPADLENHVLKPVLSWGGQDVKVGVTKTDIDAIPAAERDQWLLQRRLNLEPFVDTLDGPMKAELRILYVRTDKGVVPTTTFIRMGTGMLANLAHNKHRFGGLSAGLFEPAEAKAAPPAPRDGGNSAAPQSKGPIRWFLANAATAMFGEELTSAAMQMAVANSFGGAAMVQTAFLKLTAGFIGKLIGGRLGEKSLKGTYLAALIGRLLATAAIVPWMLLAPSHFTAQIQLLVLQGLMATDSFMVSIAGNNGVLERPMYQRLQGDDRVELEKVGALQQVLSQAGSIIGPQIGKTVALAAGLAIGLLPLPVALSLATAMVIFGVHVPQATKSSQGGAKPAVIKAGFWRLFMDNPLIRIGVLSIITFALPNYLMFQGIAGAYGHYAADSANQALSLAANLLTSLSAGSLVGAFLNRRESRMIDDLKNHSAQAQGKRGLLGRISAAADWLLKKAYFNRAVAKAGGAGGTWTQERKNVLLNNSLLAWMKWTALWTALAFPLLMLGNPWPLSVAMAVLFTGVGVVVNKLFSLVGNQAGNENAGRVFGVVGPMMTGTAAVMFGLVSALFGHFPEGSAQPFAWFNAALAFVVAAYGVLIWRFKKNAVLTAKDDSK